VNTWPDRPQRLVTAALFFSLALTAQSGERISINDNWRFAKGDPPGAELSRTTLARSVQATGNRFVKDPARRHARTEDNPGGAVSYAQREFDDSAWQRVNLPHDWAIAGPFDTGGAGVGGGMGRLPSPGVGWYRKKLDIPAADAGKSIFLDVDGAMSYATVWLNGKLVGGWPYGYASWRVELTPYVVPGGENQLAIRLDNPPDSSRWYPGGGLYRDVWLVKSHPVQVAQWGTFVTTPQVSATSATINLEVAIDNDSKTNATVSVSTEIFALDSKTGKPVARFRPAEARVAAGASATVKGETTIKNPRLWGPPPNQKPNRYVAVTTVSQAGKPVDRYETRFGIRSLGFDPDTGIHVNGERIRIQGVNQHHDLGALGAAFNVRAAERQLELLREAGCNAIRTAHNPPAPELLELADRMGFLVVDEIFDCWHREKTPQDFHLIFPDWHEPDLRAMLRRDRNHPSVILWSVGNEVGEQYTGNEGAEVAKRLCDIVREEDPTRPVTSAMNYAKPDMPMPAVFDVIGLNYQGEGIRQEPEFEGTDRIRTPPQYAAFHAKFPGKPILSTETASTLSTRGTYLFPVTEKISAPVRDGAGGDPKNGHVSAYELYAVDFGASPDKVFAAQDRHPFVAGEFVWTGWDHLGEPTPYYSSRSAYCGFIDLAGFKKDRFYLYQSRWRPDFPMAHILPHWTWAERVGQITPVHVFTSGDEAELFLNGRSLGRKRKGPYEYRLRWDDVIYEPGELRVVAYKNGKPWAADVVKTAGEPAGLAALPDRATIRADGLDLSFVTVRVTDEKGLTVPRANHRIRFKIEGPGEILATDNGDPTSFEPFQAPERRAFNGLALVIVRAKPGQPGTITLRAESDSLQGATVVLRSVGDESRSASLTDWPAGASPAEIGKRVAEEFVSRKLNWEAGGTNPVHYADVCAGIGALQIARLTGDTNLQRRIIAKFEYLLTPAGSNNIPRRAHVDDRVFGAVALEIYARTKDERYRSLGLSFADAQWERPTPDGISREARYWVDDMYMISALQLQAYRVTRDKKYLDRAARAMVAYLDKLQQPNGLFFHTADSPCYWARGNGWYAAGMTEILRELPDRHPHRTRILAGYQRMMKSLVKYQTEDGRWRQLLDRPESWPESSATAMFAYAMVTGVKRGWLDAATYGPAARKAWLALVANLDAQARVRDVCVGTPQAFSEVGGDPERQIQYYIDRPRVTGDLHGQAPILWTAAALLGPP
jgi:beta-galactosidase